MKSQLLKRVFATATALVAIASATKIPAEAGVPRGGTTDRDLFWLTVLHNNDGESQLLNAGTGLEDFGGVDRFATVVKNLRREGEQSGAVVTISAGDNFLAGPEFNASLEAGIPFYDSIALTLIGYDALTIGNHEFDFGPDVLADFVIGIRRKIPLLSANLDVSREPRLQRLARNNRLAKSVVVTKEGRRIGIVGVTTEELRFISSPRNVIVNAVLPAVQAEVDHLSDQGVDIIILASHLQGIEEDLSLAGELEDVDLIISGGGNELLANDGDLLVPGDEGSVYGAYPQMGKGGIPIVSGEGDYKYVGRLVVGFDRHGDLKAIDETSGPVRVAGGSNPDAVEPDPLVKRFVVDPVAASVNALAQNVIGVSQVALEGRRDPGVRTQETNLGNLTADSLLAQATALAAQFGVPVPDVALQNGGGIRNNSLIPAGNITELNTFDILPFANFVTVVPDIPRDQFKEILENAVSQVEVAGGRFAQVGGFSFEYDPAGTAQVLDDAGNVITPGTRVRTVTLDDGTQIVANGNVVAGPSLNIATIDFLARGGDQYPFRGAAFTTLGVSYQQALRNYIEGNLAGVISAADYPEGGEGRITTP